MIESKFYLWMLKNDETWLLKWNWTFEDKVLQSGEMVTYVSQKIKMR